MFTLLFFVFLVFCKKGTVYHHGRDYWFEEDVIDPEKGVAWGEFKEEMNEDGWHKLWIKTTDNALVLDGIRAHAAGYLEGHLTSNQIWDYYQDVTHFTWAKEDNYTMPGYIYDFFQQQMQFSRNLYIEHPFDSFNIQLELLNNQYAGIVEGYNDEAEKSDELNYIDPVSFQVLSSLGDIYEIKYYKKENRPDFSKMSSQEVAKHFIETTHCSALWKQTDDDLLFFHNTWNTYGAVLRIFKEYNFRFISAKAQFISFPSYPGVLASFDDMYITSKDLAVIETTNGIFNTTLYDLLTPKSLMYWQRVMIANRLSNSAKEWCNYFSNHNSGTYNNQWQILDMKKVKNGKPEAESFYICEQMPGYVHTEDMSSTFNEKKYWPSYNVPYFEDINNMMGYPEQLKLHPELKCKLDYHLCARSQIFGHKERHVKDISDMKEISRYNNYKHDLMTLTDSALSLASRYEYSDGFFGCHGAYDAKVSSVNLWKNEKKWLIIGSPTIDSGSDIPAFDWNDETIKKACPPEQYIHKGVPDVFDFDWIEMKIEDRH